MATSTKAANPALFGDTIARLHKLLAEAERQREDLRKLYSQEMGKRVEAQDELRRIRIEAELAAKAKARAEEEARTGVITLPANPCFCGVCLEEAVLKIGASHLYDIWVAPQLAVAARKLLRTAAAAHADNPFAPWVNLFVRDYLSPAGWEVSANGKTVKSSGVA